MSDEESSTLRNDAPKDSGEDLPAGIEEREVEDIEEHSRLRVPVIYEVVRREGETEMRRPATSLWWSGVAAGLSISFSLLGQAVLYSHLPNAEWRPLITALGYSIGFLMAVLARQQLFTETTITVVLPVLADFTRANVRSLLRMWAIVLAANFAGTFFAALFCNFSPVLTPDLRQAMLDLSREMIAVGPLEMFFRAISAGFLMAAMVWLIPSAEGAQFHIVTLMTWLIQISNSKHIVAGSVEAFLLLVSGQIGFGQMLVGFTIPVLVGNIVGGTALFALLAYAQVMRER
ncbi:MAG: formate/nitrite transporter family protein [Acetobacteraceae bacterium]|nr:formate/nitrite transporter family protein [Acetobacteraceae bacterium]